MADYTVTGDLVPDATGDYTQNGTHDGEPAYERDDGNYWIWHSSGIWHISWYPDELMEGYWGLDAVDPPGDYEPIGGATGIATVAAVEEESSVSSSSQSMSTSSSTSSPSSSSSLSSSLESSMSFGSSTGIMERPRSASFAPVGKTVTKPV